MEDGTAEYTKDEAEFVLRFIAHRLINEKRVPEVAPGTEERFRVTINKLSTVFPVTPKSTPSLESGPTSTREPNREHRGTPGRVGKKPEQAGAFRAGTLTKPVRGREGLRSTASGNWPDRM